MNEENTIPPIKEVVKSIWAWSIAHTMATACLLSFVAGWIVAKL